MKTISLLGLLILVCAGCREREMVARDPHAVVLAVKARCDADDALRAADNPGHAYLWRLDSWDPDDDRISFYISKYDDIFTRTRMDLHVSPATEAGKVVVAYSFHVPSATSPIIGVAVIPFALDRPTPEQILDRVQDLVLPQAATPPSPPARQ